MHPKPLIHGTQYLFSANSHKQISFFKIKPQQKRSKLSLAILVVHSPHKHINKSVVFCVKKNTKEKQRRIFLQTMVTAAVIGLRSSIYYSTHLSEMLNYTADLPHHQLIPSSKKMITAKKAFIYSPSFSSDSQDHSVKALKEFIYTACSTTDPSTMIEEDSPDTDISVEALLLLQKSILEKQWNLSAESKINGAVVPVSRKKTSKKMEVTCSGISARKRRMDNRQQLFSSRSCNGHLSSISNNSDLLLHNRLKGYLRGGVSNEELLSHKEVVQLSIKIKEGVWLEDHKARLKQRLGCEPSDEQLASSLNITRADLQSKQFEYCLAREKLAMSNVRLVMSIAQRYDNMGVEMADLIQGGLIGLLRGIEKFDSSKGFKISTYVYWWIRQGVTRALVDNSSTLRLPMHLHERLRLIKNAKIRLVEKGIVPSIDRIAESLNMSQKKVRNAAEAVSKVFSLDREAFPSINGLPGATLHSYIADNREENDVWNIVEEWALKEEVNKLINSTLTERETEIIRLYYGLDKECLTWEDISKRIGLSRERVRQVGLVAIEKLKHSARRSKMEAMLVKH